MKDALALAPNFSSAQKRAAEETYLEVENLIRKQVWGLVKTYGGDFDELMAEASYLFIAAYNDWPGDIPFTTWCGNWIRWALIDQLRVRISHQRHYTHVDDELIVKKTSDWRPADFIEELSEDASLVVQLVFETPAEIASVIACKGGQPRNYRSTIRSYLCSIGWTTRRITETFAEIGKALSE